MHLFVILRAHMLYYYLKAINLESVLTNYEQCCIIVLI